jgi:hypothetical protein
MMKKIIVRIFIASIGINTSYSQSNVDSQLVIVNVPVKQGFINIYKEEIDTYSDPSNVVSIFSKSDSVYGIESGVVVRAFNNGINFAVIIKDIKGTYFTYDNLFNVICSRGEYVKRGDLIGKIQKNDIETPTQLNYFELRLKMNTDQNEFKYEEILSYFKNLYKINKGKEL